MSLDRLNQLVRDAFSGAQESLVRIEEEAQREDRPVLHELSQAYAKLLAPLRDYVAGANIGRPLPRQLSKRLSEPLDAIIDREEDIRILGLKPDVADLTDLVREAETAT